MADDSLGEDVVATAGDDPAGGSLQLVDRELTIGSSQRLDLLPAQTDDGDPPAPAIRRPGGPQRRAGLSAHPAESQHLRLAPAARLSTSAAALPPGL